MRKYILILVCLTLIGCDTWKQSKKLKSSTDMKEDIETKTYRKGDTVVYEVPVVRYRDTTIYTVNRQGTTLQTVYDKEGNIEEIKCIASAIEEWRREKREMEQKLKDKESEKKVEFNTDWLLYLFGAIVALGGIFLFLMYKTINKNTASINLLAEKLLK